MVGDSQTGKGVSSLSSSRIATCHSQSENLCVCVLLFGRGEVGSRPPVLSTSSHQSQASYFKDKSAMS